MSDAASTSSSSAVARDDDARTPAPAAPGLRLDARQRAMLDEMGVKVWWPAQRTPPAGMATGDGAGDAVGDAVGDAAGDAALPPSRPVSRDMSSSPPPAPPRPAAARPDPALDVRPPAAPAAIGATRPASASAPSAPSIRSASPSRGVPGVAFDAPLRLYEMLDEDGLAGPATGGWLVVADMPPETDGRPGEPFAGEAGRLLDNMLRALQLHDGRAPVHLMRTRRAAAPAGAAEAEADFASLADGLAPRLVLALGPLAAQSLLQSTDPLGRLRGRAAPLRLAPAGSLHALPVVVSYPPAYLLRNPADKARAWADLCLAADCFATPADTPAA